MTNEVFKEYVTSASFNLTLSKKMIFYLVCLKKGVTPMRIMTPGNASDITSLSSLAKRGLVYASNPQFPGIYELTEAGEKTYDLLKIAGLTEATENLIKAQENA